MSESSGSEKNTSYGVFVQACWAQHTRQYPDELIHKEIEEFNKQCSVWWYNLSEQERERFQDVADRSNAQQASARQTYNAQVNHNSSTSSGSFQNVSNSAGPGENRSSSVHNATDDTQNVPNTTSAGESHRPSSHSSTDDVQSGSNTTSARETASGSLQNGSTTGDIQSSVYNVTGGAQNGSNRDSAEGIQSYLSAFNYSDYAIQGDDRKVVNAVVDSGGTVLNYSTNTITSGSGATVLNYSTNTMTSGMVSTQIQQRMQAANNTPKPNQKPMKDPNAPKKPLSAYFLFSQDERLKVKAHHPDYSITDVAKELGRRWATIDPSLKQQYEQRYQAAKTIFDRETGNKPQKKKKDPNAPKQPLSAYFLFSAEERLRIKDGTPNISICEVAKELGRRWAELEPSLKQRFQALAEEGRQKYDVDMASYRRGTFQHPTAAEPVDNRRATLQHPSVAEPVDNRQETFQHSSVGEIVDNRRRTFQHPSAGEAVDNRRGTFQHPSAGEAVDNRLGTLQRRDSVEAVDLATYGRGTYQHPSVAEPVDNRRGTFNPSIAEAVDNSRQGTFQHLSAAEAVNNRRGTMQSPSAAEAVDNRSASFKHPSVADALDTTHGTLQHPSAAETVDNRRGTFQHPSGSEAVDMAAYRRGTFQTTDAAVDVITYRQGTFQHPDPKSDQNSPNHPSPTPSPNYQVQAHQYLQTNGLEDPDYSNLLQ